MVRKNTPTLRFSSAMRIAVVVFRLIFPVARLLFSQKSILAISSVLLLLPRVKKLPLILQKRKEALHKVQY